MFVSVQLLAVSLAATGTGRRLAGGFTMTTFIVIA